MTEQEKNTSFMVVEGDGRPWDLPPRHQPCPATRKRPKFALPFGSPAQVASHQYPVTRASVFTYHVAGQNNKANQIGAASDTH